uniref:Uncharacterized protein n=1 Tax=Avena sativa TaxID=4498 RepID=A0ACD5X4V4_AVESA
MMWTKRGLHVRNRPAAPLPAPASAREHLPMDVLLEIIARCDVTTIVRCATATRFLRRAILDPAFRRRLALQAAAAAAGGGAGFDPALLFGVSYLSFGARLVPAHHIVPTPSSIKLHASLQTKTLRHSFQPVASRDRLLLLRRHGDYPYPPNVELKVCDTTTGVVNTLPATALSYAHAFLSVSDADGSYELLVTDKHFRFQTYSSKRGQWDAVREASSFTVHTHRVDASAARVIGRTVYWLCRVNPGGECWDGLLALDADAAEAMTMTMDIPPVLSGLMPCKRDKQLLLASVSGRLSMLVAGTCGIWMWTSPPGWSPHHLAETWSWQLVIAAEEVVRPMMGQVSSPLSFTLEGFGERSGTVIVRVDRRGLLRLDLGTKLVTWLHNTGYASVSSLFMHETDMASLLKKSF